MNYWCNEQFKGEWDFGDVASYLIFYYNQFNTKHENSH